jgi:hypothetical protein
VLVSGFSGIADVAKTKESIAITRTKDASLRLERIIPPF